MNGIINVYKEKGFTSHDVVAKLRGILKQKKIGHTGTLDPDAEGVLPVCLGKATKVCGLLADKDKTYVATLLLGITTDTQDCSGKVLEEQKVTVSKERVRQTVNQFIGEYKQVPPMYSALKVNGKKLYELARAGVEIERKARVVRIHHIKIQSIELPYVTMEISCSKGTYIRTLCHDIGQELGCGGCMKELLRTQTGTFLLKDSVRLEQIQLMAEQNCMNKIVQSVDSLFLEYPKVCVKEAYNRLAYNGNQVAWCQCRELLKKEQEQKIKKHAGRVRLYDSKERFVGIYQWNMGRDAFIPLKMFWESD